MWGEGLLIRKRSVNQFDCNNHFTIVVYQIIRLCVLNIYNSYFKNERNRKTVPAAVWWIEWKEKKAEIKAFGDITILVLKGTWRGPILRQCQWEQGQRDSQKRWKRYNRQVFITDWGEEFWIWALSACKRYLRHLRGSAAPQSAVKKKEESRLKPQIPPNPGIPMTWWVFWGRRNEERSEDRRRKLDEYHRVWGQKEEGS